MRAALAEMARTKGSGRYWRGDKDEHRGSCPGGVDIDPDPADAAASSEGEEEGDSFSDLEDFIVCKPGRDYSRLFSDEFAYSGKRLGCKSLG